jgi:hypothetical protein
MKNIVFLISVILSPILLVAQNVDWINSIGGDVSDDVRAVKIESNGNLILAGHFEGTVDFDSGPGINNLTSTDIRSYFILKTDSDGNFIWVKSISQAQIEDLNIDPMGNVYITGEFSSTIDFDPGSGIYNLTSNGYYDVFVLKLDANGDFIWAKNIGGESHDVGQCIAVDSQGNIHVSGFFGNTVDFNPGTEIYDLTSNGHQDIYVLKLDAQGDFLWAKAMGSPGVGLDMGLSVYVDNLGNVYTTGPFTQTVDFDPSENTYVLTSEGYEDVFIQKLNSDGDFLWARRIGGSSYDRSSTILSDGEGNVYIKGYYNHTVDFDPGTNTYFLNSDESGKSFILKLDSEGNFDWAMSTYAVIRALTFDISNDIYFTGYFQDTVDFNPGPQVYNLISNGDLDGFVQKLTPNGDFIWAKNIGGVSYDYANGIALDNSGNIFVSGVYVETSDFNTGDDITHTSNGGWDIYYLKFVNTALGIQDLQYANILIYPNPSNGMVNIDLGTLTDATVRVFNINGKLLYQKEHINASIHQFELNKSKGLYLIEISTKEKRLHYKLLMN